MRIYILHAYTPRKGLAGTTYRYMVYIQYFWQAWVVFLGRQITIYAIMYGVYRYTALANPSPV